MSTIIIFKRDGTEIKRAFADVGHYTTWKVDQPSAGSHTYTVEIGRNPQTPPSGGGLTGYVGDRSLLCSVFKV
jgi:hypothetical protein